MPLMTSSIKSSEKASVSLVSPIEKAISAKLCVTSLMLDFLSLTSFFLRPSINAVMSATWACPEVVCAEELWAACLGFPWFGCIGCEFILLIDIA